MPAGWLDPNAPLETGINDLLCDREALFVYFELSTEFPSGCEQNLALPAH